MQIVDMGETALDEETFQHYLSEIREHYTADKVSWLSTLQLS
jgi:desumoylating isopeptidase 1